MINLKNLEELLGYDNIVSDAEKISEKFDKDFREFSPDGYISDGVYSDEGPLEFDFQTAINEILDVDLLAKTYFKRWSDANKR